MNQLKIVFMGTATFSEAVLKNLIQHDYNIVQVVSQPDRRVGRKKELKMPEVKVVALEHDIPVFQPQRIKDDYQAIIDMQPAYGTFPHRSVPVGHGVPSSGCPGHY